MYANQLPQLFVGDLRLRSGRSVIPRSPHGKNHWPLLGLFLLWGGCARAGAREEIRSTVDASSGTVGLSKDEVCTLIHRIMHAEVAKRAGVNIISQPCTKKLASLSGKIAVDVGVSFGAQHSKGTRPLNRGDTCGGDEIVVACDSGPTPGKCSTDPILNKHWKVVVGLNVEKPNRVAAWASVLPYESVSGCPPNTHCGVMSPCLPVGRVFEKMAGTWEEVSGKGMR